MEGQTQNEQIMSGKVCGPTGCSSVKGCKNNGHCLSGGCNKMNTFDWLGNMDIPTNQAFNIVEVKFKGGRKEYYRNDSYLDLYPGEHTIVQSQNGWHLGQVSLQGELVRLQLLKKGITKTDDLPKILRHPTERDLEKFELSKEKESRTMYRSRELIQELGLSMKLSDVEYQADGNKSIFYYSADGRVDFRELIKKLASEFRIRVEMKQISLRQEAGRIGGIGVCGRELCCSTWLTDFKTVVTGAARYQNLSLNPVKLSGQCGRLKCCLNYELDTYADALKDIPTINKPLELQVGRAKLEKVDIFKRIMWFSINGDANWQSISVERAIEILEENRANRKPVTLKSGEVEKDTFSTPNEFALDVTEVRRPGNRKDRGKRTRVIKTKNRQTENREGTKEKTKRPKPSKGKNTEAPQATGQKPADKGFRKKKTNKPKRRFPNKKNKPGNNAT